MNDFKMNPEGLAKRFPAPSPALFRRQVAEQAAKIPNPEIVKKFQDKVSKLNRNAKELEL